MQGTISFHPIDVGFFEKLIQPLLLGQKVNPESWLDASLRLQRSAWCCERYVKTLELLLESNEPPPPPEDGSMWDKIRTRLERFDFRPDPTGALVAQKVDPDLHLQGRPFFITEGSADRVAVMIDEYCTATDAGAADLLVREQLAKLDEKLGEGVTPGNTDNPPPELVVRREILNDLKGVFDLARAAETGATIRSNGSAPQPASEVLAREMPWRATVLASRAVPFWIAHDVDGLETICRASGVTSPDVLVPAWRLFSDACDRFPDLSGAFHTELQSSRDIGAFVPPEDIGELLVFLNEEGSRIIQAAGQVGEGATCTTLLRKIRECARYAEAHGMGYLEASGIPPLIRN